MTWKGATWDFVHHLFFGVLSGFFVRCQAEHHWQM
jgi:hypothetical protein